MTIDRISFEQSVPSFRDCGEEIFKSILPYIDRVGQDILRELRLPEDLPDGSGPAALLARYQCSRAAYESLPHLDLVLTPNGFAVVGNQHLTPASRQRVASLRERLRREKSDARDALLSALCVSGQYRPSSLLWTPTLARLHGLRTPDGQEVYEEEMQCLQAAIAAAQHRAALAVSEEQMSELLPRQESAELSTLTALCRRFMAAHVLGDASGIRLQEHALQDHLHRHADRYPAYKGSSKYESDHFLPYENKKDDPCFFFG